MLRLVRQPKWAIGLIIVVVICVAFAAAGFWQLDRLQQRRDRNTSIESAQSAAPVPIAFDALPLPEFTQVVFSGDWLGDAEVAIPLRSREGQAGVHLATPLRGSNGVIVVDRGWVPIDTVGDYPRASGPVEITATVRSVRDGRPTGSNEAGRPAVSAADPSVIGELGGLFVADVVVDLISEEPVTDPAPLPPLPPEITEGNHLLYAIQWFSFVAITAVGFFVLVRKRASELGEPVYDFGSGD